MKNISRILFILALLCLCSAPASGYAATYTMTQEQFSEWESLSERQTQITNESQQRGISSSSLISALQTKITEANKSVSSLESTVKNLQSSLAKSGTMLQESNAIIVQMKLDLLNQQKLIDELETLLAKLKKQRSKRFGIGPYVSTVGGLINVGGLLKIGSLIVFGGADEVGVSYIYEF